MLFGPKEWRYVVGRSKFSLSLLGTFRLAAPDGARVPITSKRSKALLAMLATAREGERTRSWLQDRLWGSRGLVQAQASLRRELSNLRQLINCGGAPLLSARSDVVGLRLDLLDVDVLDENRVRASAGEFLEGIDVPGEEGFEDWLRERRRAVDVVRERERDNAGTPLARDLPGPFPFAGRPTISILSATEPLPAHEAARLEGIADMLRERVARLRWLTVIAAPGGAPAAGNAPALWAMSASLGADYLLHCEQGASEDSIQLVLSEGRSSRILWSRRYGLSSQHPLEAALQLMAEETVAELGSRIEVEQQMRVLDRGIQKLSANELVWRARWHMRRLTREDSRIAEQLLEQAAATGPNDPEILVEQAFLLAWRIWTTRAGLDDKKALRAMAMRVRHIDPFDARAHLLCGIAELWLAHHDVAKAMLQDAIELNPSMGSAYGQLGSCHSLAGQPEEAIPLLNTALRLNPMDTESFHQFGELALASYMLGQYRETVRHADRALARRPAYFYAHVLKIAALVELEAAEQVEDARSAFAAAKPAFEPDTLEWLPFKDRRWVARLRYAIGPPSIRLAG
jgi:tetratricopeptide (TPR) repeat protein